MFDPPMLFKLIQKESNTEWHEMYKVFNCGHRMELYVEPDIANQIILDNNPINISKLVEKINIEFLKMQFNSQSEVKLKNYTINNSKFLKNY